MTETKQPVAAPHKRNRDLNIRKVSRLPARVWIVAGSALAAIVTVVLWATGDIDTAARLTAYATTVLAIGTVGLAGGAIGTYVQQRKATQSQAAELTEQKNQLLRAKENDIAQVAVQRLTGAGEKVRVHVANNSSRAIRFVYVWVSVEGMTGHYHTIVVERDQKSGQDIRSRRMQNTARSFEGNEITQCYRSLKPHEGKEFVQYSVTNPETIPDVGTGDALIMAHALFEAIDGAWWTCNEDGDVRKLDAEPPLIHRAPFTLQTSLRSPGLRGFGVRRPPPPEAPVGNPGTG